MRAKRVKVWKGSHLLHLFICQCIALWWAHFLHNIHIWLLHITSCV